MSKLLRALIVEDSDADSLLLAHELQRGGYDLVFECVDTALAFKAALDAQPWDIVISDYSLPQFGAPEALVVLQESGLDLPFLVISGSIGEERAVAVLLAGAHDFITKDNLARLIPAVEREVREARLRQAKREGEASLRNSEARYRLLFDRNPLPLWVFDLETLAFLAVNDAAIRHYGFTQDEFLSMTIKDIRPAEDVAALLSDIAKSATGLSEPRTWRHRKKDGTLIDVEITAHDLQYGSRPARLVLGNDVTERKRAEAGLRRSHHRLEILHAIDRGILTAQSPESVCQLALEHIVSQMSVWGASITVFDLEAETGIVFASYSREQKRWPEGTTFSLKTFLDTDLQSLEQGRTQVVEDVFDLPSMPPGIQGMQANGLRSYVTIPLIAQGTLIGSLNLASDQPHAFTSEQIEMAREVADQLAITIQQARFSAQIQRHAAELEQRVDERTAELQRTKEHVEAILNNSSDAIVLLNAVGAVQQVNPAFTELFRYSAGDVFRQSLSALFDPRDVDVLMGVLAAVVDTGKPGRVEAVCRRADEMRFDADVALAAVFKGNEIQGAVCSLRDITERKQLEQDLRAALEKEKELNELKSRFTSMVSHEFRNPLAAILSSSDLLKSYSQRMSEERKQEHLEQIQEQVRRLVGFLDEILWLSKAQSVGQDFQPVPINIDAFCRRLRDEMQLTVETTHQIVFRSGGEPIEAMGDEKLLRQAIANLLTNAVKYSPQGGGVVLALASDEVQVVIQVTDQGIGIPEDDQKHLFETFHRAENVGDIPGTGLGLAIVKQAVEAHRGTVTFESKLGVGTTFTIQLPRK